MGLHITGKVRMSNRYYKKSKGMNDERHRDKEHLPVVLMKAVTRID